MIQSTTGEVGGILVVSAVWPDPSQSPARGFPSGAERALPGGRESGRRGWGGARKGKTLRTTENYILFKLAILFDELSGSEL